MRHVPERWHELTMADPKAALVIAPEVSVVIACRNEEDNAEAIAGTVIAELEPVCESFDIIFINNESTDRTVAIITGMCAYPETSALSFSPGLSARSCDWVGAMAIVAIFGINIILTRRMFTKVDPATAPMRTICVAMGAPMLYALERGNLVLITYTCLLLALSPLLASARLRWIFAGLAINFKVYTVASVVALLLKRQWRRVGGALTAILIVYLLSLAIYGQGTPVEIFANVLAFSSQEAGQNVDGWFPATYKPLYSILEKDVYQFSDIIGSIWVDRLMILIPVFSWLSQGLIVLAALAIWHRPQFLPTYRAIALGTLAAIIASEPGGYAVLFFMLFVLMEPWRGLGRKYAITACYILALPFDLPILALSESATSLPLQGNAVTLVTLYLTLGNMVRPLIVMSVAWAMSLTTLREFWSRRTSVSTCPV